jgi:hypothetical protein
MAWSNVTLSAAGLFSATAELVALLEAGAFCAGGELVALLEVGAFCAGVELVALLEAGLFSITELVAQVEKTRPIRHKVARNTIFFIKSPFILKRGKRKLLLPLIP